MTNQNKIKLIKAVKGEILKDWGRCKKKDLTWRCMACYAGLVVDFLDEWAIDVKADCFQKRHPIKP